VSAAETSKIATNSKLRVKKMRTETTLPSKPSDLIELALADLRKCEAQSDKYKIKMSEWHLPYAFGKKCAVCLAGAVMAQTLGAPVAVTAGPRQYPENDPALVALNYLRTGDIYYAVHTLGLQIPYGFPYNVAMPTYGPKNREKFHAAMHDLAARLREVGL
jgi:hypothetical protein